MISIVPYSADVARTSSLPVRLGPQGRIVVPAELRKELGLEEGTELAIRSDGQRLILEPRSEVLRRLRGRFAGVEGVSLADELAADRREEALQE
jgi:AbrB family looped-hinge helix DNA binding protein